MKLLVEYIWDILVYVWDMFSWFLDKISNKTEVLDAKPKLKLLSDKVNSLSEIKRRNTTNRDRVATRKAQSQTRKLYSIQKLKSPPLAKKTSSTQKVEERIDTNKQLVQEDSIFTDSSFISDVSSNADVNKDNYHSRNMKLKRYHEQAKSKCIYSFFYIFLKLVLFYLERTSHLSPPWFFATNSFRNMIYDCIFALNEFSQSNYRDNWKGATFFS